MSQNKTLGVQALFERTFERLRDTVESVEYTIDACTLPAIDEKRAGAGFVKAFFRYKRALSFRLKNDWFLAIGTRHVIRIAGADDDWYLCDFAAQQINTTNLTESGMAKRIETMLEQTPDTSGSIIPGMYDGEIGRYVASRLNGIVELRIQRPRFNEFIVRQAAYKKTATGPTGKRALRHPMTYRPEFAEFLAERIRDVLADC